MQNQAIKNIASLMLIASTLVSCKDSNTSHNDSENKSLEELQTVKINNIDFKVKASYDFYSWDNLPSNLKIKRNPIVSFKNSEGNEHFYELVYMPEGSLNWYQSATLADKAGGYLASVTTPEENAFLFNMIKDEKYFWRFPKWEEGSDRPNHHEIMIGPHLGGYQSEGAAKNDEGWNWLSEEKWEYTNWAQNLDDGIIDKDPRDNTQPNNSGAEHNQRTIGFGELNQPVPTWGDYSDDAGTYGMTRGSKRYAFIIEYNNKPTATSSTVNKDELGFIIMGSGSPNYNEERASSGTLITQGNTHILVDMGSGVRANLYRAEVDDRALNGLLFTHHHSDHNGDFDIILNRGVVGRGKIEIYGPTDTEKYTNTYLDLFSKDLEYRLGKTGRSLAERKKMITAKDLKSGANFEINGIKISTQLVPHPMENLAYRFDYNGKSIVISGDLTYIDKLAPFAKDADYLIIDSGGMLMKAGTEMKRKSTKDNGEPVEKAHLGIEESSLIAGNANVKNLVYTHFLPGTIDKEASLKIIRKNFSGKVIFATDLMQL